MSRLTWRPTGMTIDRTAHLKVNLRNTSTIIDDKQIETVLFNPVVPRNAQFTKTHTWIVNEDSVLKNVADGATSSYMYQVENIEELYPSV